MHGPSQVTPCRDQVSIRRQHNTIHGTLMCQNKVECGKNILGGVGRIDLRTPVTARRRVESSMQEEVRCLYWIVFSVSRCNGQLKLSPRELPAQSRLLTGYRLLVEGTLRVGFRTPRRVGRYQPKDNPDDRDQDETTSTTPAYRHV